MVRGQVNVKCRKGHTSHPISFRANSSHSITRIYNYWYCTKCNTVFKKDATTLNGVYAK